MSAPGLRDVQASFWRSLHTGDPDPVLAGVVLPTPTLEPEARIAVYQSMYFWRLHEVLREDFPKTCEALGDDFEELARGYLTRYPSEHPSVRHLGGRLPGFLETDAAGRGRPWLADLARLERARVDVFDAPDVVALRATDLCAVAPEAWAALRFEAIPALEMVRSRWPIHEIWASPAAPVAPGQPAVVRVWRQEFRVFHAALDEIEDAALRALLAGESFGSICEVLAERLPADQAPAEAGSLLARWMENGLLARFTS